jgi:aspartate racemase
MHKAAEESRHQGEIWGVLGGMGPLASAEFMKTIYEQNAGAAEQTAPIVLLFSDPSIPDRTESLRRGEEQVLRDRLASGISHLVSAGAARVIVCCVTIHYLLPSLPMALRNRVVSLVDLLFEAILKRRRKTLLLCTQGSVLSGLFHQHQAWQDAQEFVVFPDQADQNSIHQLIYKIKMNRLRSAHLSILDTLLEKYQVASYTAGCTELHLLTKERARITNSDANEFCVDPLALAAAMIAQSAQRPMLTSV